MSVAHLGLLGVGALLMTIPVLLHLLMKPKPVAMSFPAMRFLKESFVTTRSTMRLKHIVLMLLRCLLVGLFAAAFAGLSVPAETSGAWFTLAAVSLMTLVAIALTAMAWFRAQRNLWLVGLLGVISMLLTGFLAWNLWSVFASDTSVRMLGERGDPVAAIVLVDTSATMDYRFENETRLEKAKSIADWLIGQFPDRSRVCVAATDNDSPFFSVDTSAAQKRLSKLDIVYNATTLPDALMRAASLFGEVSEVDLPRREVYLFSGLTKKSWSIDTTAGPLRQLLQDEDVSFFVVDVGVDRITNTSVAPLELSDFKVATNGSLTVNTRIVKKIISNDQPDGGTTSRSQQAVTFKVFARDDGLPAVRDGQTVFPNKSIGEKNQSITFAPPGSDGTSEVPVEFTFSESLEQGTWCGSVAMTGTDGLAIDDARYFSFVVAPPDEVLIVHGPDASPDALLGCLAPSDFQQQGKSRFQCTVIPLAELDNDVSLSDFQAVYLLDPSSIPEPLAKKLLQYVQAGGSLAMIPGHNAVQRGQAAASMLTPTVRQLMCGRLLFPFRNVDGDCYISPGDYSHPVTRSFRDIATAVPWDRHPVYYHWGIERDDTWDQHPTNVIFNFSDREPALIERTIGNGRVIVMTTPVSEPAWSVDRDVWNDLFVGEAWPAYQLMVDLAKYLTAGDDRAINLLVGQNAVLENDLSVMPESYRVFSPDADKSPTKLTTVDGRLTYRFVDTPGNYFLKSAQPNLPGTRTFSANLSPAQTDLSRCETEDLDLVLGQDRYQLAKDRSEIEVQQGTSRRGQDFFPLLMLMTLIVMSMEHLLANRFYKS